MYQFVMDTKTGKIRIGPILILATIILFIFVSVVGLNRKNTEELTEITKNSMEAQLIAVAQSASKLFDLEAYMHYTSEEAMIADKDTFNQVLGALSSLGKTLVPNTSTSCGKLTGNTTSFSTRIRRWTPPSRPTSFPMSTGRPLEVHGRQAL